MRTRIICLLVGSTWLAAACGGGQAGPQDASTEGQTERGETPAAQAELEPTAGYQASGQLAFVREEGQVRVRGVVSGLTPDAEHGFHIHEFGDCSAADASSAGDHFAPAQRPHGRPGEGEHHLGDLENLEANAAGEARVDQVLPEARLGDGSAQDIVGRAVIVHLAADDYETQPSGGSGARIACGVIQPGEG